MPTSTPQTVLITGASSGIGLELARLFARDKFRIVLVARSEARLREIAAELAPIAGIEPVVLVSDLSRADAPRALFDETSRRGLEIDILINNAGFGLKTEFATMPEREMLDMMQLNMNSLTHLTWLYLRPMLERRRGRIMNVASTAAFQPGPLMAVYYATKSYVLSFSEAIANEVSGTGVTVTCLCPGATTTEFQKRADMENSRLFRLNAMQVQPVAEEGYRALMAGKTTVVTGLRNKLMAQSVRLAPRKIAAAVARKVQENR